MSKNEISSMIFMDAGDISPFSKQSVVVVASVIGNDGAGDEVHLMCRFDIGHFAIGDDAQTRQIAIVIENQMQLDRALGALSLGPVIQRQAQVDDSRIDTDEFVLETEFLLAHPFGRDRLEQALEDLLEQLPRTMTGGVGQRRARRCLDA